MKASFVLGLLLCSGLARAAYPSDKTYACDYKVGSSTYEVAVNLITSGSSWKSGTVTNSYPNGSVVSKAVQLTNPSSAMGGKATLWRYATASVVCELYVVDGGQELLWKNCTNGVVQRCEKVALPGALADTPPFCPQCQALTGFPYVDCVRQCASNGLGRLGESARNTCTQDLVNMIKCLWIIAGMSHRSPDEGPQWACSYDDPELVDLCLAWINFASPPGGCTNSWECPGGTFCILGDCAPMF